MRSAPGPCTQPELCTPGVGACWRPTWGCGSQQESNNTNSGLRRRRGAMLATDWGIEVLFALEQHEQRLDAMTARDVDELRQTGLEAAGILSPQLVVQENPYRVQSVQSGPTQFGVDAPRVVGAGLEHLEVVDRGGGDEGRTDRPPLGLVPTFGTVGRPPTRVGGRAGWLGGGAWRRGQRSAGSQPQRQFQNRSAVHKVTIS